MSGFEIAAVGVAVALLVLAAGKVSVDLSNAQLMHSERRKDCEYRRDLEQDREKRETQRDAEAYRNRRVQVDAELDRLAAEQQHKHAMDKINAEHLHDERLKAIELEHTGRQCPEPLIDGEHSVGG